MGQTLEIMKIEQITETSWPRHKVKSIETRKRDLVFRIADWRRDKDEPAFDVEIYDGGVYDGNQSKCFTVREHGTSKQAKAKAIAFVQAKIAELL